MPDRLALGLRVHERDVEAASWRVLEDVPAELRVDRVHLGLLAVQRPGGRLDRLEDVLLVGRLGVDGLAAVERERRHQVLGEHLVVVVADDDDHVRVGLGQRLLQRLHAGRDVVGLLGEHLGRDLLGDALRHAVLDDSSNDHVRPRKISVKRLSFAA